MRIAIGLAAVVGLMAMGGAAAQEKCGRVETVATAEGAYKVAIAEPDGPPAAALILLPGGGGFADLDGQGCAQALKGNSLIRSMPAFRSGGLVAVLADAPTGYQGREGLGGYRIDPRHAADLGLLIRSLRQKYAVPVWIAGTSRGAISAANAASRLSGADAPDGLVLTSPVTVGNKGQLAWVIQTVFDMPLKNIRQPLLVVGHEGDRCFRSPPTNLNRLADATASQRVQVAVISGGPGSRFPAPSVEACEGREPHGFADQEEEVAAGILRFIGGGRY